MPTQISDDAERPIRPHLVELSSKVAFIYLLEGKKPDQTSSLSWAYAPSLCDEASMDDIIQTSRRSAKNEVHQERGCGREYGRLPVEKHLPRICEDHESCGAARDCEHFFYFIPVGQQMGTASSCRPIAYLIFPDAARWPNYGIRSVRQFYQFRQILEGPDARPPA